MKNEILDKINADTANLVDEDELKKYFSERRRQDRIYEVLSNVFWYHPSPYAERLSGVFPINSELSEELITILDKIVINLKNNNLKAKIYLLLFLFKNEKKEEDLIHAMDLNLTDKFDNKNLLETLTKLSIILLLGNDTRQHNRESYIQAKALLSEELEKQIDQDPDAAFKILCIINLRQTESKESINNWANKIADKFISLTKYGQAILSLKIVVNNCKSDPKDKIVSTNRKIADCHIHLARVCGGIVGANHLLSAIESLRNIKDTRKERLELYEEMRECQIESMLDLKTIETAPVDITPLYQRTKKILANCNDFFDMLFRIARLVDNLPKIDWLIAQEKQSGSLVSDLFFSNRIYIDHEALYLRVEDVPGFVNLDEVREEDKAALWARVVRRMGISHGLSCVSIVEAIDIFNLNFTISYNDILEFCTQHPFIPQGHEEFYAKGIIYGLQGDFLTANHLLVPQIENSLRHLLNLRAEETTTLHANNEQERYGLNALLNNSEIHKILGVDLVAHIGTILLDKRYPCLRHSIAHGFADSDFFKSAGSVYLWWLVLRIIMTPFQDSWVKFYSENFNNINQ